MEVATKTKPSRLRANKAAIVPIMIASQSAAGMELFAGKTLVQVAEEHNLYDDDFDFGYGTNPANNEEIQNLLIRIKGVDYQVPFSRSVGRVETIDACHNWVFRKSFLSVKDADGAPKHDDNGKIVLDESKPYLSFGKPNGLTVERREKAFSPMTEEELTSFADANKE